MQKKTLQKSNLEQVTAVLFFKVESCARLA